MYKLFKLLRPGVVLGLSTIMLFSCKGKDGEPGPQGDAGQAGVQGQPGARPDSRTRQGFITGTLTGFRQDGVTPLNETFRYEFREANDLNYFNAIREAGQPGVYNISVQRGDSLGDNRFNLRFRAPLSFATDTITDVSIRFSKELTNNQLLGVDGNYYSYRGRPQVMKLSNLAYNQATGTLTGNYVYNATNESVSTSTLGYSSFTASGRPFTVTGSFDVMVPLVTGFRKQAPR